MLVVLDNARDADQVRPLLPGAPGCLVLVTSRNQLTGLIATEGASPVVLDLLDDAGARQALAERIGTDRLLAEPQAVDEIITRCARLPLALAGRRRPGPSQPTFPLGRWPRSCQPSRIRWTPSTGPIRPATCGPCSPGRTGSLQAPRPGCSGCWACTPARTSAPRPASLAGLPPAGPGRCWPSSPAPPADRAATRPVRLSRPAARVYAAELAGTDDTDDEQAPVATGCSTTTCIPHTRPGTHADWPTHGSVFEEAHAHYLQALERLARIGDHLAQARVRCNLALVAERHRQHAEAISHAEEALRLFQRAQYPAGQASSLNTIGYQHAMQGAYQKAVAYCHQALSLQQQVGDPGDEAATWDSLGYIHHQLGEWGEALRCHHRSLALSRTCQDRYNEARSLSAFGDTYQAMDSPEAAAGFWRQALHILDDLAHRDADAVRSKLRRYSGPGR